MATGGTTTFSLDYLLRAVPLTAARHARRPSARSLRRCARRCGRQPAGAVRHLRARGHGPHQGRNAAHLVRRRLHGRAAERARASRALYGGAGCRALHAEALGAETGLYRAHASATHTSSGCGSECPSRSFCRSVHEAHEQTCSVPRSVACASDPDMSTDAHSCLHLRCAQWGLFLQQQGAQGPGAALPALPPPPPLPAAPAAPPFGLVGWGADAEEGGWDALPVLALPGPGPGFEGLAAGLPAGAAPDASGSGGMSAGPGLGVRAGGDNGDPAPLAVSIAAPVGDAAGAWGKPDAESARPDGGQGGQRGECGDPERGPATRGLPWLAASEPHGMPLGGAPGGAAPSSPAPAPGLPERSASDALGADGGAGAAWAAPPASMLDFLRQTLLAGPPPPPSAGAAGAPPGGEASGAASQAAGATAAPLPGLPPGPEGEEGMQQGMQQAGRGAGDAEAGGSDVAAAPAEPQATRAGKRPRSPTAHEESKRQTLRAGGGEAGSAGAAAVPAELDAAGQVERPGPPMAAPAAVQRQLGGGGEGARSAGSASMALKAASASVDA